MLMYTLMLSKRIHSLLIIKYSFENVRLYLCINLYVTMFQSKKISIILLYFQIKIIFY